MPAENVAAVVDWYGPYTGPTTSDCLRAARAEATPDNGFRSGLYAAIGRRDDDPEGTRTLLYVGVGSRLADRLTSSHHKLRSLQVDEIWLGHISVAGIPGRKSKRINPHADIAEWALAFFLKVPSNEKKRVNPPDLSCVVLSRWWGTDWATEQVKPDPAWADIVEYDQYRKVANLVWFGPNARVEKRTAPWRIAPALLPED